MTKFVSNNYCFFLMIKLAYRSLFLLLLLLYGCSSNTEVRNIGETEYYFNEKLASLSVDIDGSCWIGTETGDVINHKHEARTSYQLGEDRIYKVLHADSTQLSPLYWIGVRNSGLQLWNLQPNGAEKIKTYTIRHKGQRYSPYDFVQSGDSLYVATSQGLYATHRENKGNLDLIYPTNEILELQNGYTFVIPNLKLIEHRLLLASTPNGVLAYNLKTKKQHFFLMHQKVDYVTFYNEKIYALSAGFLYELSINGQVLNIVKVGTSPKVYHQIEGIHYLIGSQEILMSGDLKSFITLKLRRSVPLYSRNIITSDVKSGFTFLLTNKAMWRISNHVDVFKGSNPIQLSTNDTDRGHYFLDSNNQLFFLQKESKTAHWVYSIPHKDEVKWMQVQNRVLYYYTVNNELKQVHLSRNGLKNRVYNPPKTTYKSAAQITSCLVQQMGTKQFVFMGIQDGLIRMDSNFNVDTLPLFNDKYVTALFSPATNDALYLSTLNHGIYYMNPNLEVEPIENSANKPFINDLITTNNYANTLVALTNHQLITFTPQDSVRAKGYQKLLYANDSTLYALPEFGIHKFSIKQGKLTSLGTFYNDIRFTKWATTAVDGSLFLGSTLGVLQFKVDHEDDATWIDIPKQKPLNSYLKVVFIILLLLIVGIACILMRYKKQHLKKYICQRKEELSHEVNDLIAFYAVLNFVDNVSIHELKERIDILCSSQLKKGTKAEIKTITSLLTNLNREASLILPQKIGQQVEHLRAANFADAQFLIDETEAAQLTNDISIIKMQVIKNDEWINAAQQVHASLSRMIADVTDVAQIEGCTDGLHTTLTLLNEARHNLALAQVEEQLTMSQIKYDEISSPTGWLKVELDIHRLTAALKESETFFASEVAILKNTLEQATSMQAPELRFDLLRRLNKVHHEMLSLHTILALRESMDNYSNRRKKLNDKNEVLINKRFDTDLEQYLADNLVEETTAIAVCISNLYKSLSMPTLKVMTDVLKFSNFEEQQPKVLALLMANAKVKRTYIPGMLTIYGNLNPVISRLINGKIKPQANELLVAVKDNLNPSVVASLVLNLLD